MQYPRGFTRGKHAGLTVGTIAALLGCHRNYARHLIAQKESRLHRHLSLSDVGDLVLEYRWIDQEELVMEEIALTMRLDPEEVKTAIKTARNR